LKRLWWNKRKTSNKWRWHSREEENSLHHSLIPQIKYPFKNYARRWAVLRKTSFSQERPIIFGGSPVKGREPAFTLFCNVLFVRLRRIALQNDPLTSQLFKSSEPKQVL
jgi:hypothetical protein